MIGVVAPRCFGVEVPAQYNAADPVEQLRSLHETAEPVAKPDRGLAEADEAVLLDDSATTIESAQLSCCFDRPLVLAQTFLKSFAETLRSGQRAADREFICRGEIITERRKRLGQLTDECRRRSYLACEGGALRADVSACHNSKTPRAALSPPPCPPPHPDAAW